MTCINPKGDFGIRRKPVLSVLYPFALPAAGIESFHLFAMGRR
jgi:hypothetical protein